MAKAARHRARPATSRSASRRARVVARTRAGALRARRGVLDTSDIERVHDMRVATRRLRAALEVFAPSSRGRAQAGAEGRQGARRRARRAPRPRRPASRRSSELRARSPRPTAPGVDAARASCAPSRRTATSASPPRSTRRATATCAARAARARRERRRVKARKVKGLEPDDAAGATTPSGSSRVRLDELCRVRRRRAASPTSRRRCTTCASPPSACATCSRSTRRCFGAVREDGDQAGARSSRTCSARSTTATRCCPRLRRRCADAAARPPTRPRPCVGTDRAGRRAAARRRYRGPRAPRRRALRAAARCCSATCGAVARAASARASARGSSTPSPNVSQTSLTPRGRSAPIRYDGPVTAQDPISARLDRASWRPDREAARAAATTRSCYFNRELSWLRLQRSACSSSPRTPSVPLLERVKFARDLRRQPRRVLHDPRRRPARPGRRRHRRRRCADGRTPVGDARRDPRDGPRARSTRLTRCAARASCCPALAEHGIRIVALRRASTEEQRARARRALPPPDLPRADAARRRPRAAVPLHLQPVADPRRARARPGDAAQTTFARVKVPKEMLPRFVAVDGDDGARFVPLEEVIAANLDALFPGMEIVDHGFFRVTRDADFEVSDEADDLLAGGRGRAAPPALRRGRARRGRARASTATLRDAARSRRSRSSERQVYDVDGLLDLGDLWQIVGLPRLRASCATRRGRRSRSRGCRATTASRADVFAAMRRGDVLVHHPYDSFATSVERFVEQAVADPDVLAIKQTVYRTSDDSPLVPALIRAAERGKQAVCLVELKARFDERANIRWARALEEAGVHVVYGHPGAEDARQVHPRRAPRGRRRAPLRAHRDRQLPPDDRAAVHGLRPVHVRRARSAPTSPTCSTSSPATRARGATARCSSRPTHLRDGIIERDRADDRGARARRARADPHEDELARRPALHPRALRASQAGVPVELNVRGICCLRPGVPGVSENIRVVSIVGRFLEHSRDLRLRARRRATRLHRLGRPDAAQPRHARRAASRRSRTATLRDDLLDTLDRASPTTPTPGSSGEGALDAPPPDGPSRAASSAS